MMKEQEKLARKIRGSVFSSGHQALTRGILGDQDVKVYSRGSSFYNANTFGLVYFVKVFGDFMRDNPDTQEITKADLRRMAKQVRQDMPSKNEIVIAATPDWVDQKYMDLLDGGILHECAHSLYTDRNRDLDIDRLYDIFSEHFDPEVAYAHRAGLLKRLHNIFEDAYIERKLCARFEGALRKLQKVHEFVWDLEKVSRRLPPGESIQIEGKTYKGMEGLDHFMCALRDIIEHHLSFAPIKEYHPVMLNIIANEFQDVVEASDHTEDSYDTFVLALQTLNRLDQDYSDESCSQQGEGQSQQQSGDGEGQSQQSGQSQSGDSDKSNSSSNPNGPTEVGKDESQSDSNKESEAQDTKPQDTDSNSGNSGDEEEEDSQDSDANGDSDENSNGDSEEETDSGNGSSGNENESEGDSEEGDQDSDKGSDDESDTDEEEKKGLLDSLKNDADAENMEDTNTTMKHHWDSQIASGEIPRTTFPYTRDYDEVIKIKATGSSQEQDIYNRMMDECREKTLGIRPRMLSLFRGQKKTRRKHNQEKGKRMGRTVAQVVYKDKPKPFQNKTTKKLRNSAVSLVLDESGSMSGLQHEARMVLASLALTVGSLKIPHEISGFTTASGSYISNISHEDHQIFTRFEATRMRIFRDFDEPFNVNSYKKLTHTGWDNLTPLPDAVEFATQRLLRRKEDQKILFVVTDGCPAYNGTRWYSEDYLQMMKYQVEDAAKLGIEILYIGLGGGTEFVERYPNSVSISNLNNFTQEFNQFLFAQMKRILF